MTKVCLFMTDAPCSKHPDKHLDEENRRLFDGVPGSKVKR